MSPERGKWDGMWAIVRFNWPFYAVALGLGLTGIFAGSQPAVIETGTLLVFGSGYFLLGSLGVSHWVYDCSELYRWSWLERILKDTPTGNMLLCHSGFDEASAALRVKFPSPQFRWRVLDHYDPAIMTEASIRRARKLFPPTPGTEPANFGQWPVGSASMDVIFGLLAIHELRTHAERAAWFAEARRCLAPGGRVVIAEHVRDAANLLAFGPGFLHFHSVTAWRKSWEAGGLTSDRHFRITPFVRVFVLN
ncbi:MAG: class I SAM-dependent methyltransferase [Verrucomicrobiota bacterium]